MTVSEKAELVHKMCVDVELLARSGMRHEEPGVSPQREHWLLMQRRYGTELTVAALGPEPPKTQTLAPESTDRAKND
jgi:hypothetical protein